MKKLIPLIAMLLLGSFAVTVIAKPINLSFKSDNNVELRRIETIGPSSAATVRDSTQLKIMGASSGIFDHAATEELNLETLTTRARPLLVTQAMTMPVVDTAGLAALGAPNTMPVATGTGPAAAPDNNDVLVVSEPPMLLLLALGMLLAGVRRRV